MNESFSLVKMEELVNDEDFGNESSSSRPNFIASIITSAESYLTNLTMLGALFIGRKKSRISSLATHATMPTSLTKFAELLLRCLNAVSILLQPLKTHFLL
jgi:hypothetical protein